jgi:hypothetical protein
LKLQSKKHLLLQRALEEGYDIPRQFLLSEPQRIDKFDSVKNPKLVSSVQKSMIELVKLINRHILSFRCFELTKLVAEFKVDFNEPEFVTLIQVVSHETRAASET